ncbi:MAG TPA: M1 family aminopeptidase [Phycisphaerae bacterium]|nr:M1 family aminopeptidase [Phycisphaerae bacterium]
MRARLFCGLFLLSFCGLINAGCSTVTSDLCADAYELQLAIDPDHHALDATARMRCRLYEPADAHATSNLAFDIALHRDLQIHNVSCDKAKVKSICTLPPDDSDKTASYRRHRVTLAEAPDAFELTVEYAGHLEQDIAAGEKRGEIHNFGVSAHIGTNGIYLASAAWYPRFDSESDNDHVELPHFAVKLKPVDGYEFVASAPRRNRGALNPEFLEFESTFPQTDLAIAGGQFQQWSRDVDGVRFAILLNPNDADAPTLQRRADVFLDAAEDYYHRYTPLVGPYPYDEFTIVENFFSSGFAFPTFTLLGPAVIAMEDRALRHGYLDHEFLHSWWGNGLYVDPNDGNWCEALASFGANLYGYTLDDDPEGARKNRRDACNILTRITGDNDKPLATFGKTEGASRSIGYQKGAAVFDMMAREIGIDNFWRAMRKLTNEHTGTFVNWDTMRTAMEDVSGVDLKSFYAQWVYGAGAPRLLLTRVWLDAATATGHVEIEQDEPTFSVNLPLRVHFADGSFMDVIVPVTETSTGFEFEGSKNPTEVELDPDYLVARKLADEELLPTLGGSLRSKNTLLVQDESEWDGYQLFAGDIKQKRAKSPADEVATPSPEQLEQNALVIVGQAVTQPAIQALIERSECPIRFKADGFEIDGVDYASASQSVLCSFRHPDDFGKTVTIYYGNSAESLSNAGILWFYGNSLLVFDAKEGGHAVVIVRRDFERTQKKPVIKEVQGPNIARR